MNMVLSSESKKQGRFRTQVGAQELGPLALKSRKRHHACVSVISRLLLEAEYGNART